MNTKNPIQPLVTTDAGIVRFKANHIVRDLLDFASAKGFDLNEIAKREYSRDDRQQFAQLIGYSLSGYGELRSYVDDDAFAAAEAMHYGEVDERDARIATLERSLGHLRRTLVGPMAELFGVHPDDLSHNIPDHPPQRR